MDTVPCISGVTMFAMQIRQLQEVEISEENNLSYAQYDDLIERRLEFLRQEATSSDRAYDLAVRFIMRGLSNHFSIGKFDTKSFDVKLVNRRMSRAARKLLLEGCDEDEWRKTKNEHQEPLKQVWDWMVSQRENLTREAIAARIAAYPMITVTKDEDKRLRDEDEKARRDGDLSWRSPEERYKRAGIEIVEHDKEPKKVLRKNRKKMETASDA